MSKPTPASLITEAKDLSRIPVALIVFVLMIGATLYLTNGFYTLLTSGGGDLERRFDEQVALAAGINPYGSAGGTKDVKPIHDPGGYPPWSLTITSLLIVGSDYQTSRLFIAFVNFACLIYITFYIYCRFARYGRLAGFFALASILAVSANAVALRLGQFSIIVFCLMIMTLQLSERHRFLLAGTSIGLASLKPHISGLVAIFFLLDRRWSAVISMITIIILATIITCLRISEGPIDLLFQMLEGTKSNPSTDWRSARYGILDFLVRLDVSHQLMLIVSAILALLLTIVLSSKVDSEDWISRVAIAAVCALTFTYHRRYDLMSVWFLFAAWLDQLLSNPMRGVIFTRRIIILALLGFSIWFPMTENIYFNSYVFYPMNMLWLGALLLYVWDRRMHGVRAA